MPSKDRHAWAVSVVVAIALAAPALAQEPDALAGVVRDASRAVMQSVPVRVFASGREEPVAEAVTDPQGRFRIPLPRGQYRVVVAAPSFRTVERTATVGPGSKPLDVVLEIDVIGLEVDVTPADELFADTTMSLTSTTISGDDLLDLPRNEEDLARYLLMLAGADSTGDLESDVLANFVIDGFEDGRLPSPDQIAQIVIDPDSLRAGGDGPRIEIVTRPGTGDWRWSVDAGFADESLNARTPGEARKEPRQTRDVEFELRGPLIPNKLEATLELSTRTDERAGDSLRAITPAGSVFAGVVQPQRGQQFQAGARLQLTPSHRLDAEVSGESERSQNRGVGGFTLPERASERRGDQWSVRVAERMLKQNLTNNVRFQISHSSRRDVPLREGFAIDVADAFMGGGGTTRGSEDTLALRLDDNLRWARGSWNVEWQGSLQYRNRRTIEQDNYNGTFEFASFHDYCRAIEFSGVNCAETRRIVSEALAAGVVPVYFDARGRALPVTGVPTTFTQAFGNAELELGEVSFDTHVQVDRRFGRRASLGFGVQYEATNYSRDFLRLNPTVNAQYRVSDSTLVSAGARLSFSDFGDYERLLRNDGSTHQTELSISSPPFPDPFQGGTVEIGEDTASLWVLDPQYRSPYTVTPQFSVTQQLPGSVRLTASYSFGYGRRQRRTRNINAPFPGTPLPEEILELSRDERQEVIDRMRPLYPVVGNITQIESTGRSEARTLQLRVQPRRELELYGLEISGNVNYTYRTAYDDNDFNNPYAPEWGPSRRDHGVQSRFRVGLPDAPAFGNPLWNALARATYAGTNLNFNLRANTGRLYSIQTGRDLNGDQSTRDRPAGVARNSAVGPANWNLDLTLTKDFGLTGGGVEEGGRGDNEGGGRRGGRGGGRGFGGSDGPRVRLQVRVNNLLNRSQPRAYGSVLTSPLFGLPTGFTSGRTVDLSMRFDF